MWGNKHLEVARPADGRLQCSCEGSGSNSKSPASREQGLRCNPDPEGPSTQ